MIGLGRIVGSLSILHRKKIVLLFTASLLVFYRLSVE